MAFVLSPLGPLAAEEPTEMRLPGGYTDYLSGVIKHGYGIVNFIDRNIRMKNAVDAHNQAESIVGDSYDATPITVNNIFRGGAEHNETTRELNVEIYKQRKQREGAASTNGEFQYIKYGDGKTVYFKDGLTCRIEDEQVTDEFGATQTKNTSNMHYNENRLLVGYTATTIDNLGNASRASWKADGYTGDSVFYATKDTRAVKNLLGYILEEIDSAGNTRVTKWEAGTYSGKYLNSFSQTTEDAIYGNTAFSRSNIEYATGDPEQASSYHEEGIRPDGLSYTLDRTAITYNGKSQPTSYHEVQLVTLFDGSIEKTTTDAKFSYLPVENIFGEDMDQESPDKLLVSDITTTTEYVDGATRTEATVTSYTYGDNGQVSSASGHTQISGKEASWWDYTDIQGRTLSRSEDGNGTVTYYYLDPQTHQRVAVSYEQVTAEIKDGKTYTGTADATYEILYGKPMLKEVHSIVNYADEINLDRREESTLTYINGLVNNLQRVLSIQEVNRSTRPLADPSNTYQTVQNIFTENVYDSKGNLIDAIGSGSGSGWEYSDERGWWGHSQSTYEIEYQVILGRALRELFNETKSYDTDEGSTVASIP